MALHGFVNTMHTTSWNVDANNCAGVYAAGNLDNGVMVTLTKMAQTDALAATGFEFEVTPAAATSASVWVVDTPEVGRSLGQQLLGDPRTFYNEAGKPMSLKYLVPHVDCIEVTAECFTDSTLPTAAKKNVVIGAGGKLTAQAAAASAGVTAFSLVALHTITIGMEEVPTAILRCEAN